MLDVKPWLLLIDKAIKEIFNLDLEWHKFVMPLFPFPFPSSFIHDEICVWCFLDDLWHGLEKEKKKEMYDHGGFKLNMHWTSYYMQV